MIAKSTRFPFTSKKLPQIRAHRTKDDISSKPVLLVVVYRGGTYFKECVNSIKPCTQHFSSSIISINGSEPDEDLQTASQLSPLLKTTIFTTGQELTSINHFSLIRRQFLNLLNPAQHIFLLCHDDLLLYDSFRYLQPDDWLRADSSLSLGNYVVFRENGFVCNESAFRGSKLTHPTAKRAQWLDSLSNVHSTYTNVSGMRMPSQVLSKAIKYQVRTRSEKGLRFEYICAAHNFIDVLYCYSPPLVAIREHSASEGANQTKLQFHGSEIRFMIWLFINCRSFHEIQKLLTGKFNLYYFFYNLSELVPLRYSGRRGGRIALVIGGFLQSLSISLKP